MASVYPIEILLLNLMACFHLKFINKLLGVFATEFLGICISQTTGYLILKITRECGVFVLKYLTSDRK